MDDDILKMAQEAGLLYTSETSAEWFAPRPKSDYPLRLKAFAALARADEREAWPRLDPVISWLENGCDPREAAKELRVYAAAIRARNHQPPTAVADRLARHGIPMPGDEK